MKNLITVFVFLLLVALSALLGWGSIVIPVLAGGALLGGILTFIDWLNPIRRFVRKHHGIDPRGKLNRYSTVYFAQTPYSREIHWMELGTLLDMPEAGRPHRWVIPENEPDGGGILTHYYVRCDHWDFSEFSGLSHQVAFVDKCGNRLWFGGGWNSKENTTMDMAYAILRVDADYENVHDVHLKLFSEFAEAKLKEALTATKNVAIRQLYSVLLWRKGAFVDKYRDVCIPDYAYVAEREYPSELPKQEAATQ